MLILSHFVSFHLSLGKTTVFWPFADEFLQPLRRKLLISDMGTSESPTNYHYNQSNRFA